MSPEALADDLAVRANLALAGPAGRRQVFSVGEVRFELTAPPGKSADWLGSALIAAECDAYAQSAAVHQVFAWDGTLPSAVPPPRPWPADAHEPLGIVTSHTNDSVRCALDIHTGSLIVYDYRRNASYTWLPSIAGMPTWARASPFRIALSWLLNAHGVQMVHGAAVAVGDRAVLLAGAGGAGKSTTALACALSGMRYLGDDYCAIDPASGRVHAIYNTAKVLPGTLAMLPRLRPLLVNGDRVDKEKGVIFLKPGDVELAASASLSAILLPRISGASTTTLTRASRAEVLKALLPSTIGGTMGGTPITPRVLLQTVQQLPGYFLDVGPDLDDVVSIVAAQLSPVH